MAQDSGPGDRPPSKTMRSYAGWTTEDAVRDLDGVPCLITGLEPRRGKHEPSPNEYVADQLPGPGYRLRTYAVLWAAASGGTEPFPKVVGERYDVAEKELEGAPYGFEVSQEPSAGGPDWTVTGAKYTESGCAIEEGDDVNVGSHVTLVTALPGDEFLRKVLFIVAGLVLLGAAVALVVALT